MTIALGFNCPDGIVLCTDSLESDGVTKVRVDKIWCYETQDQWGIAVASAGESDFSESFTENLKLLFTGEPFDKDKVMLTLRQSINAARKSYPELDWEALFALFGPSPMHRQLLRLSHKSKHLAPVNRYEAVGCGSQLAKFLCANMYMLFMSVEEAAELAVFTIMQCIEHVEYCGGPISVLTWKVGQRGWVPYHPDDVKKLEAKFPPAVIRNSLLDFWIAQTPNVHRLAPIYRDLSRGGFVKFNRSLCTKSPTQSAHRKSKRAK